MSAEPACQDPLVGTAFLLLSVWRVCCKLALASLVLGPGANANVLSATLDFGSSEV